MPAFCIRAPASRSIRRLQRPESRGEIRLRSADPIEAPMIDPRYFASDPSGIDLATMVEGVRISRRIAAQSPLKEILAGELPPSVECESDADIADYIRGHCTTLYHPSSTCRMGTDPMAVVDPASHEGAWARGPAHRRRLGDPQDGVEQHQRADDHDRGARRAG